MDDALFRRRLPLSGGRPVRDGGRLRLPVRRRRIPGHLGAGARRRHRLAGLADDGGAAAVRAGAGRRAAPRGAARAPGSGAAHSRTSSARRWLCRTWRCGRSIASHVAVGRAATGDGLWSRHHHARDDAPYGASAAASRPLCRCRSRRADRRGPCRRRLHARSFRHGHELCGDRASPQGSAAARDAWSWRLADLQRDRRQLSAAADVHACAG